MTRRHHSDPLRLDGLDAWITREPEEWREFPPDEDEPVICPECKGEGDVPCCEECTCNGHARVDCGVVCRTCGGKGWL